MRPAALLVAFLTVIGSARAAEFFVSPRGNDASSGTKDLPFASIQHAQTVVNPGDTVFIRGGTYRLQESDIARRDRLIASIIFLDKSGTKGKPVKYTAYPEERPVFDCSEVKPPGLRVSVFQVDASWIHLSGIEVTGAQVTLTGHTQSICFKNRGDHNFYERLSMHDGQAIGLFISRGADNLVLNCDAYRNHDYTSEGGRGGNTDGFGSHVARGGANNVFRGCRAWFNSDDGFDCINSGSAVTFENCWAMYNGYSPKLEKLGDGNGFKAGGYGVAPGTKYPQPVPRHRVIGCIAVGNRAAGFYANHHPGGVDWIDNRAFRNSVNYNLLGRSADGASDVPGQGHTLANNLSYGTRNHVRNLADAGSQRSGNSFDRESVLQDSDFLSLEEADLTAPRQENGELPKVGFLRFSHSPRAE